MIEGVFWDAQPEDVREEMKAALSSGRVKLARLVEFDFSTGPVRFCDWVVSIHDGKDGHEWKPMPVTASVKDVARGSDNLAPLRVYRMTIPLDLILEHGGQPGDVPDLKDKSVYYKRDATSSLQLFKEELGEHGEAIPLGHPLILHRGRMDKLEVSVTRDGVDYKMRVEGFLARKGVQGAGLLTPRDQNRRHPGDLGLQYVLEVESRPAIWPDY